MAHDGLQLSCLPTLVLGPRLARADRVEPFGNAIPQQGVGQVRGFLTPIAITNTKGKGAVLVGEDEWAAIEETLYLMGIPDMAQSLIDGRDTPAEECVDETALEW